MAKATNNGAQDIDALRQRHNALNTKKIQAEQDLKNVTRQLDALKKAAKEKHGTDDLEQLKKLLAQMQEQNEQKRTEYQKHLDQIEQELAKVDQKYEDAGGEKS
jgi:chromosome segregation ATPase